VHIGGGCSNISFGLPKRKLVNFAGLAQAIYHGMDAGLIDPCAPGIIAAILAAEAVAGKDDYCMNYINAEREGILG
jgi:5-methyltetrahydrofolate--homocysteine methyltransferase